MELLFFIMRRVEYDLRDKRRPGGGGGCLVEKKDEQAEYGIFAQELNGRFKDLRTREDRIQASLSTLNALFPNSRIKIDDSQAQSDAKQKNYSTVSNQNEVVISSDVLDSMTSDSALAEKVRKLFEGFVGGDWNKNLIDSRQFGGEVWKSMNIQVESVGYYESYQTANGVTSTAIANLRMQFDYRAGQNLDALLGVNQNNSANSGQNNIFSALGQSSQFGFSSAWQLSGFFSNSAAQFFGANSTDAMKNQFFAAQSSASILINIQIQLTMMQNNSMSLFGMFGLVDPLVLDLADEGINLTAAEDGVYFDMHGKGQASKTSFISGNNAFLYLDANGNGVADDIHELFGDSEGHANGFAKLAQYDSNGDGVIDENDEIYSKLRLWRDLNGDGVNQADESMTLAEAGIKSINLNYQGKYEEDGKGNVIGERSTFTRQDGSKGTVADVWLRNLS